MIAEVLYTLQLIQLFHKRTKYLEIYFHFFIENIQQGLFKLLLISIKSQQAYFFKKNTTTQYFQHIYIQFKHVQHLPYPSMCEVVK